MQTERVELSLDNLTDLDDGKVQLMFAMELKRALLDCLNRPGEGKARKVSLICAVVPEADEAGNCEGVRVSFDVKSTLPARKTLQYPMGITKAGQAWFSKEEEEDVTDPIRD
jgi:hypothetical protein